MASMENSGIESGNKPEVKKIKLVSPETMDSLDQFAEIMKDFLIPILAIGICFVFCRMVWLEKPVSEFVISLVSLIVGFVFGEKIKKNGQ